ncbi:MAG: hypothetical protein AB1689_22890 [Thermodesulfobacteriota bacterium]
MRVAIGVLLALALAACDVPEMGPPPGAVDTQADPVEGGAQETRAEGDVQVIVRLRFEAPAGAAPDSEAYKSALTGARERFLRSIDAVPHRVVRTYDTLPLVVLSLPAAQRAEIERSPLVASVEDDRLNAPLAQ